MHKRYNLFWLLLIVSLMVCANSYAALIDGLVSAWTFDGNLRDSAGSNDGEFIGGGIKPPAKDKPKGEAGPTNLAKGIVAGWDFDGDLEDDIDDNDGDFWGAPAKDVPVYVDGRFGEAVEFDGIDDYVEIPDDDSLHLPEGLTIAAWMNPAEGKDHAGICWKGEKIGWGPLFSWRVATTNDANMTWGRCAAGTEGWFATDGVLPGLGEWTHVAMTVMAPDAPTNMRVYVNGEDVTDVTGQDGQNTEPPFLVFEGEPVEIGVGRAIGGTVGNDTYFNGMIDDVGIWDRGLTADEIEEVMNKGLPSRFSVDSRGKLVVTWGKIKHETWRR